jgi:serine/threonine protein phosphatase 1
MAAPPAAPPRPFASLLSARPTWAVGAIHGEAEKLRALHAELGRRFQPGQNLVYLGNYLGRGPDVTGTVQELLLFRRDILARPRVWLDDVAYLRGSQEEMWAKLLQIQFAPNPSEVIRWLEAHGIAQTVAAYGGRMEEAALAAREGALSLTKWTSALRDGMRAAEGHNALLSALKHAAYTDDKTLLFVNAGLDAGRPLTEQGDSFWWGGADFDRIDQPYGDYRRIVRGFDPRHRGLALGDPVSSIDGGCGFDGVLIAVCFDDQGNPIDMIEA